jgi:hypothetical protein
MGFRTTIQRFVNDHLTIVVLCNRTDINPEDLALKVADLELEQLAEIASNGNQKK